MKIMNANINEKLYAAGMVLLGSLSLIFAIFIGIAILNVFGLLVAHFAFGYSWVKEKSHLGDLALFSVIVLTPLLFAGTIAWIVLRSEYERILWRRTRKC